MYRNDYTRWGMHARWGLFSALLVLLALLGEPALNSGIKALTGASYLVTTGAEEEYYYCRKRPVPTDQGCYMVEPLTGGNIQICGPISVREL